MSRSKSQKAYWDMTAAELREATRKFDFGDGGPAQAPPLEARAQQLRARRKKAGRPRVGEGARRVSVSIEGKRLKLIDREAKRLGLNRSEFIARAITKQLTILS